MFILVIQQHLLAMLEQVSKYLDLEYAKCYFLRFKHYDDWLSNSGSSFKDHERKPFCVFSVLYDFIDRVEYLLYVLSCRGNCTEACAVLYLLFDTRDFQILFCIIEISFNSTIWEIERRNHTVSTL